MGALSTIVLRGSCLGENLASFQIYKMHHFTCKTGDGNVALTISQFFFGCVALNTKAGIRAAVENRNHPLRVMRITSNGSAR